MNTKQKLILKIDCNLRDAIFAGLKTHGKIKITGLGVLEIRRMKAKKRFDLKSRVMTDMKSYNRVKFIPTKQLKLYVQ